jgi:hypothetical protein
VPLETLWHCVVEQSAIAHLATGWYRKQALRRLDRWVRHLAGLAPIGGADIGLLFEHLPVRMAMSFIAWHGDVGHLPHLVEQMGGDEARHAGWAWRLLTGVDLVAAGLALPEPERRDDDSPHPWTPAGPDDDAGLPLPDAAAVGAWPGMPALAGRRCLLGRPLDVPRALDLLDTGMQAVRSIAAQFLTHAVPGSDIAVRGPVWTQRMRCEALRESVAA